MFCRHSALNYYPVKYLGRSVLQKYLRVKTRPKYLSVKQPSSGDLIETHVKMQRQISKNYRQCFHQLRCRSLQLHRTLTKWQYNYFQTYLTFDENSKFTNNSIVVKRTSRRAIQEMCSGKYRRIVRKTLMVKFLYALQYWKKRTSSQMLSWQVCRGVARTIANI